MLRWNLLGSWNVLRAGRVLLKPPCRTTLFTLQGSVPVRLIRNPKRSNWGSFRKGLKGRLERCPVVKMKGETGLWLVILSVQLVLISDRENNCPLKLAKTGRHSLKSTSELVSLRKRVRVLFNTCRTDKNPQSWELYREAQRRYRKKVTKTSKDAWRTFCNSNNVLPM
jgi:hypothetical protein